MNIMNLYVYENRSMSNDLSRPLMLENLNVDNVQIHIPKEIDGTDMGTWAWWFVYQNAKREKYSIPMTLEGTSNDDGEEEYISTVGLNHGFTGKHGTVMYAIEAIQADGSGAVTHEWHTKTYKLEVVYTLQGNQTEYDESESDIISALISRVNELIQSGAEIAEIAETIENAAETAQEVIDSIPADYSALSAQVDTNTEDIGGLKADLASLSLGINPEDDLIYIYLNGVPIGDGVEAGGSGTRYNVSWNLSNATSTSHIASVAEGKPLNATLSANDSLVLTTVQITMGELDVTSTVYNPSNGRISIASVTGDVVIIAKATEGVVVFSADFTGEHPLASQFYSWEGRDFEAVIDSMSNIVCANGVVDLKSYYDSTRAKWIEQLICTGGLFESDNFTLTFKAKFNGTAGSWNNVITYGTGTHWTNGTYSDGVKWPAGGEIDAFEQAGGYKENPNTFSPVFHYGAGSNSYFPHHHDLQSIRSGIPLPVDEWADYKFVLKDGVVTLYVNDEQVAQGDGSELIVNNEYLWNYHPFLKPQAFYIDAKCASRSASIDTSNEYHFYVKDFDIVTESKQNTPCTALSIYPQMWGQNATGLVFPTNAEIYFDRVYTPANTSNKACTWESSDTSIATVCQGYVKTKAEGTCTITATCGNATAIYSLVVSDSSTNIPCVGIIIDTNTLELVEYGSVDLSSEIYKYPRFTTQNISLSSSDTSVASVNGTTVNGVGIGTANITITCGNATTIIPITVSSGLVFESDIDLKTSNQDLSSEAINYDFTQTYSFQYTFKNYTPKGTQTAPNCIVGPARSNVAIRNGCIKYLAASETWNYYLRSEPKTFTPVDGDILTLVHNFATGKMNVYLNDNLISSNATIGQDYFTDTAKVVANKENANMTVAPTHIKIAIGDLHPTA